MEKKWIQRTWAVCALAMICCMLWGSAFPCIKIGYRLYSIESADVGSQMLFAGIRFTLAGILTVLFVCIRDRKVVCPGRSSVKRIILLSLAQTVVQYYFFYVGLANASGVKASIIEASNVFLSLLAACYLFRTERMTIQKLSGCLIGFAGVILINVAGNGLSGSMSMKGEGFIFLSAASYALSSGLIKIFSRKDDPAMLSGYQFVLGGLILVGFGLNRGGQFHIPSASGLLLLFYMAMISAVAYTIWSFLLKYNPVGSVAVFGFMNPVIGVVLSALLLDEKNQAFTLAGLFSLLLVSAGIYVVNAKWKKEEHREDHPISN